MICLVDLHGIFFDVCWWSFTRERFVWWWIYTENDDLLFLEFTREMVICLVEFY